MNAGTVQEKQGENKHKWKYDKLKRINDRRDFFMLE